MMTLLVAHKRELLLSFEDFDNPTRARVSAVRGHCAQASAEAASANHDEMH
jgi:hypothetical protein